MHNVSNKQQFSDYVIHLQGRYIECLAQGFDGLAAFFAELLRKELGQ